MRFNPGIDSRFIIQIPISVIHHINRLNEKGKLYIYPRRCRKVFDQIQYPFLVKTHIKLEIEGNFFSPEKRYLQNTIAKSYLIMIEQFSFKIREMTFLLLPLQFNSVLYPVE